MAPGCLKGVGDARASVLPCVLPRHRAKPLTNEQRSEASQAAVCAASSQKKLRRPEDWQLAVPLTYRERLAVFAAKHRSGACLEEGEPLCQTDDSCGHLYCVRLHICTASAWQLRVRRGLPASRHSSASAEHDPACVQEWLHTIFKRKTLVCDKDWLTDRLLEGLACLTLVLDMDLFQQH